MVKGRMPGRMLKNPSSSVLASKASSQRGPGRLTDSAARTNLVLLIRRTARPRGYASGVFIGCGLAGRLFEQPAGLQFQVLATVYLFAACYDRARWKWQRRN